MKRKSLRVSVTLLFALTMVLAFSSPTFAASKPHRVAPYSQPVCTYTAWYERERTSGSTANASYNAYLFVDQDIYTHSYCGYMYTSIDWSETICDNFTSEMVGRFGVENFIQVYPGCATHGSIQSTFTYIQGADLCVYLYAWINTGLGASQSACWS